ncbi:MAG TPA: enoyl-CoA hydratase-related protein [Methylomirabilota bacterium]|nr:enoyl-CoA hydratase-related protein [Methylomirabilota bacterium]
MRQPAGRGGGRRHAPHEGRRLIRREDVGAVAVLTLDNPPLNVLSRAMYERLERLVDDVAASETIRAVVLTGAGERAFSAGADVKEFPGASEPERWRRQIRYIFDVSEKLAALPQPVVAAVNGVAYGGGFELTLFCDVRVASARARFALPEVKLGLFPGTGGVQRLPALIGVARAKELLLRGEPIDATDAERLGVVTRVWPADRLAAESLALAQALAERPGRAVRTIKRLVDGAAGLSAAEERDREIDANVEIIQTADAREGFAAFIEKRPPRFQHR